MVDCIHFDGGKDSDGVDVDTFSELANSLSTRLLFSSKRTWIRVLSFSALNKLIILEFNKNLLQNLNI